MDGLEVGAQIVVGDLKLPEGVEANVDAEHLVVSINIADESDFLSHMKFCYMLTKILNSS